MREYTLITPHMQREQDYIYIIIYIIITRKMVPITGRASSFLENILFVCTLIERKRRRGRQNKNYRAINLPNVI